MVSYGLWMFFQLKTHREIFNEPPKVSPKRGKPRVKGGAVSKTLAQMGTFSAATVHTNQENIFCEPEDEVEPQLTVWFALLTLLISTVLIAFNTQFATDSIQGLLQDAGLSETFVGLVILPILSNDFSTIVVAAKDKMDVVLALTLEKCIQTSLLIVPLVVLLAWCMGIDQMTLEFDGFSIAALFAAVIIVTYVIQGGTSDW